MMHSRVSPPAIPPIVILGLDPSTPTGTGICGGPRVKPEDDGLGWATVPSGKIA